MQDGWIWRAGLERADRQQEGFEEERREDWGAGARKGRVIRAVVRKQPQRTDYPGRRGSCGAHRKKTFAYRVV